MRVGGHLFYYQQPFPRFEAKKEPVMGNSTANWENISMICLWQSFRISEADRISSFIFLWIFKV